MSWASRTSVELADAAPAAVDVDAPDNSGSHRAIWMGLSVVAAILFIFVSSLLLPSGMALVLLGTSSLSDPFTVQNVMWIVFFVGIGEIGMRFAAAQSEMAQLASGYLPEDIRTVLRREDLSGIYRDMQASPSYERRFLTRLLSRCILQFQASEQTSQCAALMNTSLDMFMHELDLQYSTLRYITWLIPSLGFIGTVVGIGQALAYAGRPGAYENPALLSEVTSRLAVAFDTTFLALMLAAVLLLFQHIVQAREERAVNLTGQYCLDNLINRLYSKP